MTITAAQQQHARKALAGTKRRLPDLPGHRTSSVSLTIGGAASRRRNARPQPLYSGYSFSAAREKLRAAGWQPDEIEEGLHRAVAANLRRFVASWVGYVSRHGWLHELLQLDEATRTAIISECRLEGVWELLQQGQQPMTMLLSDLAGLAAAADEIKGLEERREQHDGPLRYFMEQRYGLPAELSLAVLKYGQAVPWWVFVMVAVFAVICGWIFWLAIVDPHNPGFENAGGVSWVHYTIVPLFGLAMVAVDIYLIRDRPRRERAWRKQAQRYLESGPAGTGSGRLQPPGQT